MRNKTYSIRVKMIYETEMLVSDKSMNLALIKVSKVLNDSIRNKIDLTRIFDKNPIFKYKVELKNNLSNK